MANMIVPNGAELKFLDRLLEVDQYTYHLFRNDYVPVATTVFGDLQEATFSGYVSIDAENWLPAVTTAAGRAISFADVITFEHDGGGVNNDIYGYYVTLLGDPTNLRWVQRFEGTPWVMNSAADQISFTPAITLKSEF